MPELSESDRAWWVRAERDYEDPKAHEKLHTIINFLERNQDRKRDLLLYASMYAGGLPPAGGGTQVDTYIRSTPGVAKSALGLNVLRSIVDAVVSRIFSKSKPKVSYVTEGGDYERQHQAEQLERGVDGVFYREKAQDKFVRSGRDACIFGLGSQNIEADFDQERVIYNRHLAWQTIIDEGESVYEEDGGPRSLYTARYVDKHRLIHMVRAGHWADGDDEEREAKARLCERLGAEKDNDAEFGYQQVGLRVRLERAWHRPSGRDAGDGRYVVGVSGCTLIDRVWGEEDDKWPFAFFTWSPPVVGFYGQGIVEIGSAIQAEINKSVREVQNGLHLIKGHWVVNEASKVRTAHLNNDLSTILKYAGTPDMKPEYYAPQVMPPEVYQWIWQLVSKLYELTGVSQMSAAAQKPAGLDSGEAQRVYADQQTETLLEKGERYQAFVLECAALTARAARELAKEGGSYEVRSMKDDAFQTIDWKELEDPDGFECRMAPISSLPGTPAAKIQLAEDLLKVGDFDAADVLEIIGMPDILQKTALKQASRKLVEKKIGLMLREGTSYEPHAMLNLAEAVDIANKMYCLAELNDTPDEKLALVRDFIAGCQAKLTAGQPPAPPPALGPGPGRNFLAPGQPGMPAMPPGPPGAPPGPPPAQAA